MVRGGPEVWEVITSFCEAVMLSKEVAERDRERFATDSRLSRGDARCVRRQTTISGHRRRGLVDGEQRVARHPIRTEPVSTACCVPREPQGAVSTH